MNLFLKFNQVIYSSSPISWLSFKPLAQILFGISCWQDFIQIFFQRGVTPERERTRTRKKKTPVSNFSMRNPYMKFQNPSMDGQRIWHALDFIRIFSKGHNSRKGDNSDKKKKKQVSNIFPWGIHIWNFKTLARTVLEQMDAHMDACKHAQPETNMPRQLLWSWGHNNVCVLKHKQFTIWYWALTNRNKVKVQATRVYSLG